jgi:hypothetical protein
VTGWRVERRRWLAWAASIAITASLLAYLFRDISVYRIVETARGARPGPFVAFLAIFAAGILLRATRFWVLLGRTVPFHLVLAITAVRNLLVDLLPARLGELSYVYLVSTRAGRPIEDGVATMAIAFLLDVVALAPLVLAALLIVGSGEGVSPAVAVGASVGLATVGATAVLFAGPIARRLGGWMGTWASWPRAMSLSVRFRTLADRFDAARQDGVLVPAFVLSIFVRLAKYGSAYCLVLSLLLPFGYSVEELGVSRIFLGSVAGELAAALPIHGLAGFGTYEAAWALTLEELGYPREHAVVSGLLAHAITQGIEYVLGGLAILWLYTRRARE